MQRLNLNTYNGGGFSNALGKFFRWLITVTLYVVPSLNLSNFSILSARQKNLFKHSCFSFFMSWSHDWVIPKCCFPKVI